MNPDSEDFKQLRRLLALKRHEQPPPGYFNNFSRQVIARIEAGERLREESGLQFGDTPWLRWLWDAFGAKPAFAGVFGAAICAMVISGIMFSEDIEPLSKPITMVASEMTPPLDNPPSMAMMDQPLNRPQFGSSTMPVAPVLTSLFDQFQISAQPASANFGFPGGN